MWEYFVEHLIVPHNIVMDLNNVMDMYEDFNL